MKYKQVIIIAVYFVGVILNSTVSASFQSNHDVIFDGDTYPPFVNDDVRLQVEIVKYSKEGNRVVLYGTLWQNSTPFARVDYRAFIVDFDGSNLHEISLPQRDDGFTGALQVNDFAINDDGTKMYLSTFGTSASQTGGTYSIPKKLYRIDVTTAPLNTEVTQIADFNFLHPVNTQTPLLQTTSSGDWVYYSNTNILPGGGHYDIFRVSSAGDVFQTVVQDSALDLTVASSGCQGQGDYISPEGFSISGDGSKVLFRIRTIYNESGDCMFNKDWWVLKTATSDVLLNPSNERGYVGGTISSDGSKIVIADDDNYHSYDENGTNPMILEPQSYNFAGSSMTLNGEQYFYRDNVHEYGLIANTNGVGVLPILPENWSIFKVAGINHFGNRIAYAIGNRKVYAGQLYVNDNSNSLAPMADISFDPPYIIEGNTDPVKVFITTNSMVGDIADVLIDNLSANNKYINVNDSYSHHFRRDPQDNGFGSDVMADDGIYTETSDRNNNGSFDNLTSIVVRATVIDTMGNFKVVEKELNIGIYSNGFE